jgi:hypothetical protein
MSPLAQFFAEILRQRDLLKEAELRDGKALAYVRGFESPAPKGRRVWTRRDKKYDDWINHRIDGFAPPRRVVRLLCQYQPRYGENPARPLLRAALEDAKRDGMGGVIAPVLEDMLRVHDDLLEHFDAGANDRRHEEDYGDLLARYGECANRVMLYLPQKHIQSTERHAPANAPERKSVSARGDAEVHADLVGLQQMADLVQRVVKTLHNVKILSPLPAEIAPGVWRYSEVRPWLLQHWPCASYRLPEDFAPVRTILTQPQSV